MVIEATKPQRRLNTDTLEKNGITFDKTISKHVNEYLVENFPQASIVTEGLLDFKQILSQSSFEKLSEQTQKSIERKYKHSKIPPPNKRSSVDMDSYEEQYQIFDHDARFELARGISRSATNIKSAKETRWSAIVKNELFGNLIQSSRRAEGVKVFDPKQLVERVKVEDEDVWEHARKALRRTTPRAAAPLTAPKVDLYIALPIFKRVSKPRGFHRDDYIQNFTEYRLTVLEEKHNGNLISNPITPLDRTKKINEKHLVCFPSAVVEIKHHQVSQTEREKCYCQVANAASTALSMLSRLSHFSIPGRYFGEIQPVVAFTFIGYKSRVWIAFISEKIREDDRIQCKYEVRCIWKGDLRKVWDTVRLCRIIENLHYWTVRHFRPWVSSCLDRWHWMITAEGEEHKALISELEDLKSDGSSEKDPTPADEDYEVESEEGSESEDEEDEDSMDDGKDPKYDSTSEDGLMSTDESSDIESEEGSERTQIPRIRLDRAVKARNEEITTEERVGNISSKSFRSTPQRRRNSATLSPEILHLRRAPLSHGETSPLPLLGKSNQNYVRSRSTG